MQSTQKSETWGEILRLSLPTVSMYLGVMLMQVVDLMYIGRISPVATAAFSFSNSIYIWFLISGIGLFSALDFIVSFRRGSAEFERGELAFGNAILLCVFMGIPVTWILIQMWHVAEWMKLEPEVVSNVRDFHFWLSLTWIPTILGIIFRSYAQAFGRVRLLVIVLVLANLLNWALNEILVLGTWGLVKPMGVRGAGIATFWSRNFMLLAFWWGITYLHSGEVPYAIRRWRNRLRWRAEVVREVFRIGMPAAFQFSFEVGAFATSATLSNLLGPIAAASHQIVLNIGSVVFMIPNGIGSAAAVMIGKRYGEKNLAAAKKVGDRCLKMILGLMVSTSIVLLVFPNLILEVYTSDPEVLRICRSLLLCVALFQIFDGIQGMLSGALRGLGDTKFSMWVNMISHWMLGLPSGILICFWLWRDQSTDQRILGLWIGLAFGLAGVAAFLLWRWKTIFKKINPQPSNDARV